MHHTVAYVEVRGQPARTDSFLIPDWSQGSKSSCQAPRQVPLPAELS